MADILLKNVGKEYDKTSAFVVKDFNLEIRDKEFMVFVGPSGCGKTTILRMIAGLEDISEGEIFIGGQVVNDLDPKDRDVAMVFQSYALYPHLTVFGNIAYPLKQRKVERTIHGNIKSLKYTKVEISSKVNEVAKLLNVQHLLNRKPKQLSGGERQRVALARAMVRNPKAFLMDEPLSNLDAQLRSQTRSEILRLHKEIDTTFIYVTHDQTEALTMGDRIVVINKGEIQQVDTPYEVFNHPSNVFVARFIGTPAMNMLNATCSSSGSETCVEIGSLGTKLRLSSSIGYEGEVILGVRSEDVTLASSSDDSFEMNVDYTELLGNEMVLHLKKNGTELICKLATENYCNQKTLSLVINPEKVHLFNPITEKSLQ